MTLHELRVRFSFPAMSAALPETGRAMDAWVRAAAKIVAPELTWAGVSEDGEVDRGGRWGSAHVLRLEGIDAEGTVRGRGEALLAAGGDRKRVGGNGLIEIETIGPARYLQVDNHCNVSHWDVVAAPLTDAQIDQLRRALEDVLGRRAEIGGERKDAIQHGAQLVASGAPAEDAALWMEDLRSVGIECRGHAQGDRLSVFAEHVALNDVEALRAARVVLGEVLSEAGHEDWHERSRQILVRLPHA